jgi:outer membrane protein assembly factor BamB
MSDPSIHQGSLRRDGVVPDAGVAARPVVGWGRTGDVPFVGEPVRAGDTLLVCDAAGAVHAVSLADATTRWTSGQRVVFPPVAVAEGVVYVPGPSQSVTALELTDGTVRWRAEHRGDFWEREHPSATAGLTVLDDLLVYRTSWGIHAVDRHDGAHRWWAEAFTEVAPSHPAVCRGLLLHTHLETDNGNEATSGLVATRLVDGSPVWEHDYDDNVRLVVPMPPVFAGSRVLLCDVTQFTDDGDLADDGQEVRLVALDAPTGTLSWARPLPGVGHLLHPPVVRGDTVWQAAGTQEGPASPGLLFRHDARTGAHRSTVDLPAAAVAPPLVAGGCPYVLGGDGVLRSFDPATGRVRWSAELPGDDGDHDGPSGLCVGDGWVAVTHHGRLTLLVEP